MTSPEEKPESASPSEPHAKRPPRRGCRRAAVVLVVLALAGIAARRPILERIPALLVLDEPERDGDAIVVLAGDGGERVEHAVTLWKKGRSKTGLFVVSGGPAYWKTTWASLMASHAEAIGVPRASILEQSTSRTTVEDAEETLALLEKRADVRTIILVTSAWHSRRAKAAFVAASRGRHEIVSCPAPAATYPEGWWHDAPATRAIVTEILKYFW